MNQKITATDINNMTVQEAIEFCKNNVLSLPKWDREGILEPDNLDGVEQALNEKIGLYSGLLLYAESFNDLTEWLAYKNA